MVKQFPRVLKSLQTIVEEIWEGVTDQAQGCAAPYSLYVPRNVLISPSPESGTGVKLDGTAGSHFQSQHTSRVVYGDGSGA